MTITRPKLAQDQYNGSLFLEGDLSLAMQGNAQAWEAWRDSCGCPQEEVFAQSQVDLAFELSERAWQDAQVTEAQIEAADSLRTVAYAEARI